MEDHRTDRTDRTDRITDLLRELPRERARPGFTARVLERLDSRGARAARPAFEWRPAAVLAALALAVAIPLGIRLERHERHERESARVDEAQRILQELRAEHGRLEQELQDISEPRVLYLGGDEEVDLVLDLSRVPEAGRPVPAAYHDDKL
jgi:hypothetical protein